MDPTSQFIVPTIIDVPELIVTNEDLDYDYASGFGAGGAGGPGAGGFGGGGGGACGGAAGRWSSKLQFLGTALSYAIGLGNLWRFPYLCYKHAGGAFLLAYTLVLLIVGMPLFLMELAFGQYANEGPITIWRISPAFEGIGYSMCLISAVIAIYYNLLNAWILQYLLSSLTFGALPWTSCDNSWNSELCFLKSDEARMARAQSNCSIAALVEGKAPSSSLPGASTSTSTSTSTNNGNSILVVPGNCTRQNSSSFEFEKIINSSSEVVLPSNEFFHAGVLQITRSADQLGGPNWGLLFGLTLAWLLVFLVLLKNLRPFSSNRLTLISLIMPYLSLFALLSRALSLPGSSAGLAYLLSVDWVRLQDIDIWTDAITQTFFALSPCWGGIISLANMNKFHNNFHSDTMLLMLINYATSLAAALVAFGTLGFMANYSGIQLAELADSGIGFIFQVYPECLAQLPLANLNSILFFALLLFIGFSSQLTVIETVVTTIVDTWPHKLRYRRPLVLVVLCGLMLVLSYGACFGNGFYLMMVLDAFSGTISGMIIGILELIAIAWVYGMENFMQDIDDMISVHRQLFPSRAYWYFMWRYLTPSTLFAVLLFCLTDSPPLAYRGQPLPGWAHKLGWIMTVVCIALIPIIALIRFLLSPSGSLVDKISYLCRPSEDWAPSSYISGPKLLNRHQVLDDSELRIGGYARDSFGRHGRDNDDDEDDDDDHDHDHDDDHEHREGYCSTIYRSKRARHCDSPDGHQHDLLGSNDDESKDDADPKLVDGKANYIIPEEDEDEDDEEEAAEEEEEEEDDNEEEERGSAGYGGERGTSTALMTNETNV